ncbi:MAG: hypothetical protein QOE90_3034 [Thermoplasmata archaeon]|nr:hypothetical protein [Thermoplasmata archaeon]
MPGSAAQAAADAARRRRNEEALRAEPCCVFANGRGSAVGACDVQLLSGVADGRERRWRVFAYGLMRTFDVTAPDERGAVLAAWELLRHEQEAVAWT